MFFVVFQFAGSVFIPLLEGNGRMQVFASRHSAEEAARAHIKLVAGIVAFKVVEF